jgi:hypothetical protein
MTWAWVIAVGAVPSAGTVGDAAPALGVVVMDDVSFVFVVTGVSVVTKGQGTGASTTARELHGRWQKQARDRGRAS